MNKFVTIPLVTFLVFIIISCTTKEKKAQVLYANQCASCHLAPDINALPKAIWKDAILPEMGARMGIRDSAYSPYSGYSLSEKEMLMRSGVYSQKAAISKEDWNLLKDYILRMAPDSLPEIPKRTLQRGLPIFKSKAVNLDSIPGSSISFLEVDGKQGAIKSANLKGDISTYDYEKNKIVKKDNFENPITWYSENAKADFITMVGILNPSEIAKGKIYEVSEGSVRQIANDLHRPVHTTVYDLDNDGSDEILVSEFGHLTGALSLWKLDGEKYTKKVLLGQPGVMRTIVKDMNNDNKEDIILLSTQGNEGVTILYQTTPLSFRSETVIRFSPVYGSSWFDLLDYDGDGDDDIVTVHGDNGDKSYVNKPYHGMRIHINDGSNNFEEKFFYPMYGATRFTANDFDEDGDIDFALLSSFPDYEDAPEFSFVYLENQDSGNFKFDMFGLEKPNLGRWLLIDSNDVDGDGDKDIVLSAFSYYFTPVPEDLWEAWRTSNVDLLILENTKR